MAKEYLGTQVHDHPDFYLQEGSYFDPSNGDFRMVIKGTSTSGESTYQGSFVVALRCDDSNDKVVDLTTHIVTIFDHNAYFNTVSDKSGNVWDLIKGYNTVALYMYKCTLVVPPDGSDNHRPNDCLNGKELGPKWSLITLSPPKISNLYNSMPYDGDSDVSASETSIRVGFTNNSTNVATKIAWNVEGYTGWQYVEGVEIAAGQTVTDFTIPWDGFEAGKTYLIKVNLENDAGPGTDPSELSLTIRTLHRRPTLTISHNHRIDSGLEDVSIHWESDKNIQEIDYTIDGSNWIVHSTGLNARSGTIKIDKKNGVDLFEDTIYDFEVTVKSTNAYDHRWDTVYAHESLSCKTDMKAYLTDNSPRDLIIGDRLHIQKTNESGNANVVRLYVATDEMDWKEETAPNNDYYITMTQDEWDAAYRKFISPADFSKDADAHNKIPIKIRLVTLGRIREYISEYTGLLILTGDMLTAHTNVGGVVKRGKVWARPGSEPKRGVTWISTATGHWRRGI